MSAKESLIKEIDFYKSYKYGAFMAVSVQIGDAKNTEVIINFKENFDAKKEYYENAYDEDLKLKANPSIQIVDWAFGKDFEEIQDELGM